MAPKKANNIKLGITAKNIYFSNADGQSVKYVQNDIVVVSADEAKAIGEMDKANGIQRFIVIGKTSEDLGLVQVEEDDEE